MRTSAFTSKGWEQPLAAAPCRSAGIPGGCACMSLCTWRRRSPALVIRRRCDGELMFDARRRASTSGTSCAKRPTRISSAPKMPLASGVSASCRNYYGVHRCAVQAFGARPSAQHPPSRPGASIHASGCSAKRINEAIRSKTRPRRGWPGQLGFCRRGPRRSVEQLPCRGRSPSTWWCKTVQRCAPAARR